MSCSMFVFEEKIFPLNMIESVSVDMKCISRKLLHFESNFHLGSNRKDEPPA